MFIGWYSGPYNPIPPTFGDENNNNDDNNNNNDKCACDKDKNTGKRSIFTKR